MEPAHASAIVAVGGPLSPQSAGLYHTPSLALYFPLLISYTRIRQLPRFASQNLRCFGYPLVVFDIDDHCFFRSL